MIKKILNFVNKHLSTYNVYLQFISWKLLEFVTCTTKNEKNIFTKNSFILIKTKIKKELAFIYSTTRTATVSSLSDMELISIGREDFFDIFMTNNKGEEPEHIKYLRACSFIKYWPIEKLIDYPQHCHYHYYK